MRAKDLYCNHCCSIEGVPLEILIDVLAFLSNENGPHWRTGHFHWTNKKCRPFSVVSLPGSSRPWGLLSRFPRLKTAKLRRLGMSQYGVCFNAKRTRHSRVNKVLQIKIKSHILFRKTFLNVSFRSVLSESDNLFVSTWSQVRTSHVRSGHAPFQFY